jgi:hypothetical protein
MIFQINVFILFYWNLQDKTRLLVCLKTGIVYEYDGPGGRFDTSTSYLIESQLSVRIFRFRSIKSRLRVSDILFLKK